MGQLNRFKKYHLNYAVLLSWDFDILKFKKGTSRPTTGSKQINFEEIIKIVQDCTFNIRYSGRGISFTISTDLENEFFVRCTKPYSECVLAAVLAHAKDPSIGLDSFLEGNLNWYYFGFDQSEYHRFFTAIDQSVAISNIKIWPDERQDISKIFHKEKDFKDISSIEHAQAINLYGKLLVKKDDWRINLISRALSKCKIQSEILLEDYLQNGLWSPVTQPQNHQILTLEVQKIKRLLLAVLIFIILGFLFRFK